MKWTITASRVIDTMDSVVATVGAFASASPLQIATGLRSYSISSSSSSALDVTVSLVSPRTGLSATIMPMGDK
jgi:hypothetical protein